jgi:hypothetical protein
MSRVILSLFFVSIGLVYAGPAGGQTKSDRDVVAIGKQATALVEVTAPRHEEGSTGTAFCIDKAGLFITNAHVVNEAEEGRADIRLVLDAGQNQKRQILRARLVRSDERLDLALLSVDPVPGLVPLLLGRDELLRETMPVRTFGFPFAPELGPDITVLESKITSLRRSEGSLREIQFDNRLNPGNSGGPVLGPDGKVVGVARATLVEQANLMGTGISVAIPVGLNSAIPVGILQAFLRAPVILFNPPTLAYKGRSDKVTWTIKVQPSMESAPLPDRLSVSVTVATDVTPPRTFDATSKGTGTYQVTFIPVPKQSESPVELRVQIGGSVLETSVPDRAVRVGKASLLLSDLQRLIGGNPPHVITRKGEMVVGPISNLGTVKAKAKPKGKTITVDLSRADVIHVTSAAAAEPLRAIAAVVELKRGSEVLATKARHLEFPDAPMLVIDRARGVGMVVQRPPPPVIQTPNPVVRPDPVVDQARLQMGGTLRADGVSRGAGLSMRPPAVAMGDVLLADGSSKVTEVATQKSERTEPLVRSLGAKLTDLAVGGGGRYLIMMLKEARQVAIFDVNAADVVKRIDVPSDEVLLAAGADKLILLYPATGHGLFQRYSLKTMDLEIKGQNQPLHGRILQLAMGSDSDGPILACWSSSAIGTDANRGCFIDPVSLKVLKLGPLQDPYGRGGSQPAGAGAFQLELQAEIHRFQLRASPSGCLFTCWKTNGNGWETIALRSGELRLTPVNGGWGHALPGSDDKTIYGIYGRLLKADGQPVDAWAVDRHSQEILIPSTSPSYYLGVTGYDPNSGHHTGPLTMVIRLANRGDELATIHDLDEMTDLHNDRVVVDTITLDRRFHFIPQANLLVTIPHSNDRLVLRRLDLDRAIATARKPLLVVTSPSEIGARPGQNLAHQVVARSSKGAVRFELASGPPGLTVTPEGTMTWRVPLDRETKEYEAILTISDASGRQIFHTIRIKVE